MIYVTHDQEEAFTMSTQVAVMAKGAIRQMAPPADLYRMPADLMVARFVGDLNEVAGRVLDTAGDGTRVDAAIGPLVSARTGSAAGARVVCTVRPEHLRLRAGTAAVTGPNEVEARVRAVIFGGSWHRVDLDLAPGIAWRAEGRGEPPAIEEGGKIVVGFAPEHLMLFNDKE
jgi:ABC-type Fe3+/spermidine/putrescine transport system ATPase subunit